jgi:hypothetical protein
MKFLLPALTLIVANTAFADTTQSTPVPGNYTLQRGNTTVVTAAGTMLDCEARARADAQSRAASASYNCTSAESFTVTYIAVPVQCASTQPADDSQQATCPGGTYGTFTQTRSYALQPSPTCWQPGGWSPTTPAAGACSSTAPSGAYATKFDTTENPINEGGMWRRANNAWTNVRTANGIAFGTNGVTNSYDDSYAYLVGAFGPDQTVEAVVYRSPSLPSDAANEVELLLRVSDDANNVRAYEVNWQAFGGQAIVRWNGPFGSFTMLSTTQINYFNRPLMNGDVLKATIVGNVITMYVNGVPTLRATDATLTNGSPGIGFFLRPGFVPNGIGFTSLNVTSP